MRRKRIPKNLSPLLSSSSPARPSPLSPPSLPVRVDRSRLALSSFPPTDSLFLPASYKDAANLFILTSRDGMPRSGERGREREEKVATSFQRGGGCMRAEPTENTDPTCLSLRGCSRAAERGRKPAIASFDHASVANFTPSTRLPFQYSCSMRSGEAGESPPVVYDHRRSDRYFVATHPHSSDILFAIFFFFRRRKRFAFLEHTLLFSLSPPSCSEKYYNSIEKTKQTESDRLERRTFVEGKHVACVRTLRTAVE